MNAEAVNISQLPLRDPSISLSRPVRTSSSSPLPKKTVAINKLFQTQRNQDESTYNWLDVNNFRAFEGATKFLVDLGHKDIGFINGFESMNFSLRRRDGYLNGLEQSAINPNSELMFSGEMIELQGYEAIQTLLKRDVLPTAVLCRVFSLHLGPLGRFRKRD